VKKVESKLSHKIEKTNSGLEPVGKADQPDEDDGAKSFKDKL